MRLVDGVFDAAELRLVHPDMGHEIPTRVSDGDVAGRADTVCFGNTSVEDPAGIGEIHGACRPHTDKVNRAPILVNLIEQVVAIST